MSMLTAAQVATMLSISRRLVYELASSGELPSYRFGDAIRFEAADVLAFKESSKVRKPLEARTPLPTVRLTTEAPEGLAAYFRSVGLKPKSEPSAQGGTRLEKKVASG